MNNKHLSKNEEGIVAIFVTVFFMIVLSLIVLAFSQNARRQQQQTIDNQLSRQAFYAAESGINDTVNGIKTGAVGFTAADDNNCETTGNTLSADGLVSYSCVLWNRAPKTLEYNPLDQKDGEIISLNTVGGSGDPMKTLNVTWNAAQSNKDFSGCATTATVFQLPKKQDYTACDAGMLRLFFVAAPQNPVFDRTDLIQNSFTIFLRPTKDSATTDTAYLAYSSNQLKQGAIFPAKCDSATGRCSVNITGINGLSAANDMFLQFRSMYKDNAVTLSGTTLGGSEARFDQAQIEVDSTGKANDVLRRLQVRVPLFERYSHPQYVLEAFDGICKQLDVYPGQTADPYSNCGGL